MMEKFIFDFSHFSADRNNDDIEALQRVRDQSITLGISSTRHFHTGDETPPPSPAEFGLANDQRSPLENVNNKVPPTAVAENSDLTHQFDNSQGEFANFVFHLPEASLYQPVDRCKSLI